MVEIIPYKSIDNEYQGKKILHQDCCRKETVAVLYNGATMIPLCKDCLSRIDKDIRKIVEGEIE